MIKITITGSDIVANQIRNAQKQYQNTIKAATRTAGLLVEKQAKLNCPVKSGDLRRSIHSRDSQKGNVFIAEIGPDESTEKYAVAVERGHSQTPGRYVPALGKRLVASFVQGKWYMARTAIQTEQKVKDVIKNAFKITYGA
jgi:hypothetical protein